MNGDRTPLNMEENLESSGSYNSLPDETRRPGQLERAFRRRTVRDVLSLVDDLDAKAEFAPLERAYVVYSVLKTRQYADEGARWANLGAIIFFVGIVCAALTPALVALTGMYAFSNAPKFHRLQFAAICASLMGTIAHACVEIKILRRVRRVYLHAIDATPARWRGDVVDFHTGAAVRPRYCERGGVSHVAAGL